MRIKYNSNEWVDKWYNNFICAMKQIGFNETYANLNYKVAHKNLFYVGDFRIMYGDEELNIYGEYAHSTTTIVNIRSGRIGFSRCSLEDVFDPIIGIAIAWARYCGETVPDEISITVPISELVSGDEFYYNKKKFIFVAKSPVLDTAYIVYRQMADGSKLLSTLLAAETTLVEKI